MQNDRPSVKKFEFHFPTERDRYWLNNYTSYRLLTIFLNAYMDIKEVQKHYDERFSMQQDFGIHNKLDWLINQFMNELLVDKFANRISGRTNFEWSIIDKLKKRLI